MVTHIEMGFRWEKVFFRASRRIAVIVTLVHGRHSEEKNLKESTTELPWQAQARVSWAGGLKSWFWVTEEMIDLLGSTKFR